MKKLVNNLMKSGRIFQFSMLTAVALVAMSCEENDDAILAGPNGNNNPGMSQGAPAPGESSIAAIATDAQFFELVNAMTYVDDILGTDLVDMFANGKDQYTVFAPTDDAFSALYETLDVGGIQELDAELVLSVLQYHVVEGRRASNSVVPKNQPRSVFTILGEEFSVTPELEIIANGNTANIIAADISASNGIIHVIDAVILP